MDNSPSMSFSGRSGQSHSQVFSSSTNSHSMSFKRGALKTKETDHATRERIELDKRRGRTSVLSMRSLTSPPRKAPEAIVDFGDLDDTSEKASSRGESESEGERKEQPAVGSDGGTPLSSSLRKNTKRPQALRESTTAVASPKAHRSVSQSGSPSPLASSAAYAGSPAGSPARKSWQLKGFAQISADAVVGRLPLVYLLGQVAQLEEKKREAMFEHQLGIADDLYMLLLKDRKAIEGEMRRRRLAAENEARIAKEERNRQHARRRRVLLEQDQEREILWRIQLRAFEDILRLDVAERQRRHTLHNVEAKKLRKDGAPLLRLKPIGHDGGNSSVNSPSAQQTLATKLRSLVDRRNETMYDESDSEGEEECEERYDVTQQQNRNNGSTESTTASPSHQHTQSSHHHHPSPGRKRALGPKGLSSTAINYYLSGNLAPLYMEMAEDSKTQVDALNALRKEMKPSTTHKKKTTTSSSKRTNHSDRGDLTPLGGDAQTSLSESDMEHHLCQQGAIRLLQCVGRGYAGRSTTAIFQIHLQGVSPKSPLSKSRSRRGSGFGGSSRPASANSLSPVPRPGSATYSNNPASIAESTPRQQSQARSHSVMSSAIASSAEQLRTKSDRLLRKVKNQRKALFPKITQQREFDDLYQNEEQKLQVLAKIQAKADAFNDEMDDANDRFTLPKHVTIYDPYQVTAIQKELKEAREKRLKDIREDAWHAQNRVRLEMAEKLAEVKVRNAAAYQKERLLTRRRDRRMEERRAKEKNKRLEEERRAYGAKEKKSIERLELHINLREEFLAESRVTALQQAIIKVPGAARIAAMTSSLSVDKAVQKTQSQSGSSMHREGSSQSMSIPHGMSSRTMTPNTQVSNQSL